MSKPVPIPPAPPVIPDHELFRSIGRGSYGEVWLARNVMGTWRAVKIVRRERFDSDRPYEREFMGIKRFEPVSRTQEAQVDVLHVGRNDAAGYFYYVMELADDEHTGQEIDATTYKPKTLRSEMEHGTMPAARCLDVGIALCGALEHLHTNGLVHRDIKPSNIIFVHARPKLADIGLVAGFDETLSFVGTEGFAPPEGPGTPAADLYSLGKVLYELHTGLDRTNFPTMPAATSSDLSPDLVEDLNLIIQKACAPAASARHPSARALREELQLLQNGRSIRRLRLAEKRAVVFRRVGVAAIAVAVLASVGYGSARQANQRADVNAHEATTELLKARYAEARALRLSGTAGRRAQALTAIHEAALVRPSRELRDEAIATLALTDLEAGNIFIPHPAEAAAKAVANPARSVFSDDLTRVAWCNLDATVSIVRFADRVEETRLPSPGEEASALGCTWSADGKYLAVAYRGEIRVWELAAQRVVCQSATTAEPTDAGAPVSFSADSTRVALHSEHSVMLHALPGGELLKRVSLPADALDFRLHPTEPWIAARMAREVLVFDYQTHAQIKSYPVPNYAQGLQWSPDGRSLGVTLRNGQIFVGDVYSKHKLTLAGTAERSIQLAFSANGERLASVARDGSTRLWNALAGGPPIATVLDGLAQKFSSDGKHLAYTRAEGVGVWNVVDPGRCYTPLVGRLGANLCEQLEISPDGKWMVSNGGGADGLAVWDLSTRRLVASGVRAGPDRWWLRFTPDGKTLLTLGQDGLQAWPVHMTDGRLDFGEPVAIPLEADARVTGVAALSADGRRLLVRVQPQGMDLIALDQNNALTPIATDFEIRSLAWSPDGRRVVAGTHKNRGAQLLEATDFHVLRAFGDTDTRCTFSPDGLWLVASTPGQCAFYHATTLRSAQVFQRVQLDRTPGAFAFSGDGRYGAYLKRRGQAEIVDSATLTSLATIDLPDGAGADDLVFSADAQWLVLHDRTRAHLYHLPTLRSRLRGVGLDW